MAADTNGAKRISTLVPVLLQVAGFVGFCASVVVTIAVDERQLLAFAGLCASVACGGYVVQARKAPAPVPPGPHGDGPAELPTRSVR